MRTLKVCVVTMLVAMSLMNSSPTFAKAHEEGDEEREEPKVEADASSSFLYKVPTPSESKKEASKIRFLYRASNLYLWTGTTIDMVSTVHSMNHPTVASREDQTFLADYHGIETGWAKSFGERNTAAAIAANVCLNVGINWLSQRLYRKGGHWRMIAIGLNVVKGTDNLIAGVRNIRSNADVDRRVGAVTGYSGRITWSH